MNHDKVGSYPHPNKSKHSVLILHQRKASTDSAQALSYLIIFSKKKGIELIFCMKSIYAIQTLNPTKRQPKTCQNKRIWLPNKHSQPQKSTSQIPRVSTSIKRWNIEKSNKMTFRSKEPKTKKGFFFALIIHQKDKYIPLKAEEVSTARNHSKISSKLQSLEFLLHPCVNQVYHHHHQV